MIPDVPMSSRRPAPPRRPVLAPRATDAPPSGRTASFSVVIATYQAAAWLPDAVESALGQTHPPHEVIVVDDGSTDDTPAALAEGARSWPYALRPLLQANEGPAAARNTGPPTS